MVIARRSHQIPRFDAQPSSQSRVAVDDAAVLVQDIDRRGRVTQQLGQGIDIRTFARHRLGSRLSRRGSFETRQPIGMELFQSFDPLRILVGEVGHFRGIFGQVDHDIRPSLVGRERADGPAGDGGNQQEPTELGATASMSGSP